MLLLRNEARRRRLKNFVRMKNRRQEQSKALDELVELGQQWELPIAPIDPFIGTVAYSDQKVSVPMPAPKLEAEPAPKTRADKARELYNADRYSELFEFKRICKKSWEKLGFNAYEQFEIENNIHN